MKDIKDITGLKLSKKHSDRNDAIYNSCLEEVVCSVRKDNNHFRTSGIDKDMFRYRERSLYEEDMVLLQSRHDFCGINVTNRLSKWRVFLV